MITLQCRNISFATSNRVKIKQTLQGLSILIVTALFVPAPPLPSPGKAGIDAPSESAAQFNRRYIRINDYLFNGAEDATAIAFNRALSNNPAT